MVLDVELVVLMDVVDVDVEELVVLDVLGLGPKVDTKYAAKAATTSITITATTIAVVLMARLPSLLQNCNAAFHGASIFKRCGSALERDDWCCSRPPSWGFRY